MPFVLEPSWIGRRVSVRRVIPAAPGDASAAARTADVVGDLLHLDGEHAVIDSRHGPVDVPLAFVQAARIAPPSTADELALQDVMARGWPPVETAELGGWRLRAAGGFTGRANSVLPLARPGRPLDEALSAARAWYAARDLPLWVQVPTEARRLLDAELAERGWSATTLVHVMAARLDRLDLPVIGSDVQVDDHADEAWLARVRGGAGAGPDARRVLTGHPAVAFASVRRDGATIAVGRGAVDDGWLGVTAVEVDPGHRRLGLARAVLAALVGWGRDQGAHRGHLQVGTDNDAALALYRSAGYWVHHDYHYRIDPS
jgi:ribosomal protein S18 acetylase RimI-like enzyme